jgi:hypothetical protein
MTIEYPKQRPDLFWLVVGLITLAILLTSCSSNFYCKRCPSIVKDSTHITEKDSIVLRDSVVLIPRDSIRLMDSVPCGDFTKEIRTKTIYLKVSVKDSVLTVDCRCEAIEAKLSWWEHHYKKVISNYHSEQRTAYIKKKTGFGRFKDWWFYVTASLLLLALVRKIIKTYTKLQIPF